MHARPLRRKILRVTTTTALMRNQATLTTHAAKHGCTQFAIFRHLPTFTFSSPLTTSLSFIAKTQEEQHAPSHTTPYFSLHIFFRHKCRRRIIYLAFLHNPPGMLSCPGVQRLGDAALWEDRALYTPNVRKLVGW